MNKQVVAHCTQFGQPFGMLHSYVEYIAMKHPCLLTVIQLKQNLIYNF